MSSIDPGLITSKDSPWWLKAGVQFGVPALLCVFLVWWIVGDSNRDHAAALTMATQTSHSLAALQQDVGVVNGSIREHIDSSGRSTAALLYYLQQLCIQGAASSGTSARDCTYKEH